MMMVLAPVAAMGVFGSSLGSLPVIGGFFTRHLRMINATLYVLGILFILVTARWVCTLLYDVAVPLLSLGGQAKTVTRYMRAQEVGDDQMMLFVYPVGGTAAEILRELGCSLSRRGAEGIGKLWVTLDGKRVGVEPSRIAQTLDYLPEGSVVEVAPLGLVITPSEHEACTDSGFGALAAVLAVAKTLVVAVLARVLLVRAGYFAKPIPVRSTCNVLKKGWVYDGWVRHDIEALASEGSLKLTQKSNNMEVQDQIKDAIINEVYFTGPQGNLVKCIMVAKTSGNCLIQFSSTPEHEAWLGRITACAGSPFHRLSNFLAGEVATVTCRHHVAWSPANIAIDATTITIFVSKMTAIQIPLGKLEYHANGTKGGHLKGTISMSTGCPLMPVVRFKPPSSAFVLWGQMLFAKCVECNEMKDDQGTCRGWAKVGGELAIVEFDMTTNEMRYVVAPWVGHGSSWPFVTNWSITTVESAVCVKIASHTVDHGPKGLLTLTTTTGSTVVIMPLHEDHSCIWSWAISRSEAESPHPPPALAAALPKTPLVPSRLSWIWPVRSPFKYIPMLTIPYPHKAPAKIAALDN